jgi:hypothetical protein
VNKTLYLRDEDGPLWDRARELSNDKLSPVVVSALKSFIAEKEAQSTGFGRIIVTFQDADDHNLPKAKSFYGRWIIPPEEGFGYASDFDNFDRDKNCFAVAVTAKGNIVVYSWRIDAQSGDNYRHSFRVYSSFQEAATDNDVNWAIRQAMERRGVPVEELDI